jgi:myosin heavy subunit
MPLAPHVIDFLYNNFLTPDTGEQAWDAFFRNALDSGISRRLLSKLDRAIEDKDAAVFFKLCTSDQALAIHINANLAAAAHVAAGEGLLDSFYGPPLPNKTRNFEVELAASHVLYKQLQVDLDEAQGKIANLQAELETQRTLHTKQRQDHEKAARDNTTLQSETEGELIKLNAEVLDLRQKLTTSNVTNADLRKELAAQEAPPQSEVRTVTKIIKSTSKPDDNQETQDLKAENQRLTLMLQSVMEENQQTHAEIAEMQEQLITAHRTITSLEEELRDREPAQGANIGEHELKEAKSEIQKRVDEAAKARAKAQEAEFTVCKGKIAEALIEALAYKKFTVSRDDQDYLGNRFSAVLGDLCKTPAAKAVFTGNVDGDYKNFAGLIADQLVRSGALQGNVAGQSSSWMSTLATTASWALESTKGNTVAVLDTDKINKVFKGACNVADQVKTYSARKSQSLSAADDFEEVIAPSKPVKGDRTRA